MRSKEPIASARMPAVEEPSFWLCATALDGSITKLVALDVFLMACASVAWVVLYSYYPELHLRVGPVEIAGGAMGLMLVFRNNGGYERWWEGRKLWGQITNAVRTLVQAGLAYGPKDAAWQHAWVHWCAAYPHACRLSLRSDRDIGDFQRLLGRGEAEHMRAVAHMPTYVSFRIAALLAEAARQGTIPPSFLVTMESARERLVDAIGGCERIASTPLPRIYVLKFRRFIAIYLLLVPAALVDRVGWVTPLLTTLIAYPALGLDRIAEELQAPFNPKRLNHLPLESMCWAIEGNSLTMLEQQQHAMALPAAPAGPGGPPPVG